MLLRVLSVKFWPLLLASMCSYFYVNIHTVISCETSHFQIYLDKTAYGAIINITFERYYFLYFTYLTTYNVYTSNGSWCIGIKGEMSGTVCVTFTWDIYIYMSCLYLLFVLLFVHYCNVMVYLVYCVASGKQEKVQACLVTLWLFIISCHSLSKTTLGSLCSWKPAWSLKKRPHSMCLKPFVKMCIFVVIQIFWSLRKYREQ